MRLTSVAAILQKVSAATLLLIYSMIVTLERWRLQYIDDWQTVAIVLAGFLIALLGLFQPAAGYARKIFNETLLCLSLIFIGAFALRYLARALDSPDFFTDFAIIFAPIILAALHALVSIAELGRRLKQYSLRGLVLGIVGLAACGLIIANLFYARIATHNAQKPVIAWIDSLKGRVTYRNWEVDEITFWGSQLAGEDFSIQPGLQSICQLNIYETHVPASMVPWLLKLPKLELIRMRICSSISEQAVIELRKQKPNLVISK